MINWLLKKFTFQPKFQPGDLIAVNKYLEKWQSPNYIFEIKEIGKKNYRLIYRFPIYMDGHESTQTFDVVDKIYKKLER